MYNLLVSECCTGYGHVAQRNVPQLLGQSGHPVLVVLIHVAQSPNLQETLRTELKESRGACWGGSSSERSGPPFSSYRYTTEDRQQTGGAVTRELLPHSSVMLTDRHEPSAAAAHVEFRCFKSEATFIRTVFKCFSLIFTSRSLRLLLSWRLGKGAERIHVENPLNVSPAENNEKRKNK